MLASEGSAENFSSPCSSTMEPPSKKPSAAEVATWKSAPWDVVKKTPGEIDRNWGTCGKNMEKLWELLGPWWKIEAEILEASSFTVIFLDETADVKKASMFRTCPSWGCHWQWSHSVPESLGFRGNRRRLASFWGWNHQIYFTMEMGTVWCSRSNVIKECDLAKLQELMFHPLSLWCHRKLVFKRFKSISK